MVLLMGWDISRTRIPNPRYYYVNYAIYDLRLLNEDLLHAYLTFGVNSLDDVETLLE